MNIRVQTNDGTATEIAKNGLERIEKLCDVMSEKFGKELAKFKENSMKTK